MSIDLCTLGQARSWLGLSTGQTGNSAETNIVNTTIALAVPAGIQTVTPISMNGITANTILCIDPNTSVEEYISVTAVASSAFTATFAFAHAINSVVIDVTDSIIARLISSASAYWLWYTGRINPDGSIPSVSPLVAPVSYNEWYDGNGNQRLFLRNSPITAVASVQVNGVTVPASTGFTTPGYIIDQNGRSLVLRSAGGLRYGGYGGYNYSFIALGGAYSWACGTQNINIAYTAGYVSTPPDVRDATIKLVGLMYRRKGWIGYKQNSQNQTLGTVQYDLTGIPDDILRLMDGYKRIAQAG